jgi:hypothetical protein
VNRLLRTCSRLPVLWLPKGKKGYAPPRMGLLFSVSRELTRQEVHHTFERIEAERLGHGRP